MHSSLLEFYLPEQVLVKVDRASMYNSVECRTPFLDHRLVEFVSMMPADIHYGTNNGKILLRNLLPKSIPNEIRWRSKRGFTPPISDWFKTILKNNVANSFQNISKSHIVHDEVFFKSILNNHLAGNEDNTHEIFKWFMINEKFLE